MGTVLHLLAPSYLFNKGLGPVNPSVVWPIFGFLALVILFGFFYARAHKKKDALSKRLGKKVAHFCWTMGIIGILLVLFRQISVLYLGAPILFLLWLVIFIVWLVSLLLFRFKTYPKRREELKKTASKREYIP